MTLTLVLMRHAKSSWDDPTLPDHDRPLNGRGRRSAAVLGDWLRAGDIVPDQCLTSTARRTLETFEGLRLDIAAEPVAALYHAAPETMLAVLQEATGRTVLMLGHNPGIADFAHRLVRRAPDHPRFIDYPTCATLVARFDGDDWSEVGFAGGEAVHFVIPRELAP